MTGEENSKLAALMRKADAGYELTLGFFGGSITQGSLASSQDRCYAYLVCQWWKEAFPNSVSHYVNAGIGGTDSHFGVSRIQNDLLMYRPDFVMVDFSVNDIRSPMAGETYEGVLRRLLTAESNPAILVLNNVYYDTGANTQEVHNKLAAHYQIPFVSARDTIYQRLQAGVYQKEEITPDGLHPNDFGHRLLADEIIACLEQIKTGLAASAGCEGACPQIPPPVTSNRFEHAKRLTIANLSPRLNGFRADSGEKGGHLDFFKNGWMGSKLGDRLTAAISASCIAVQYRRTAHRPSPTARLVLDGDSEHPVLLDGCFDEDWGDCLFLKNILADQEPKEHLVEIEIIRTYETAQEPFYLLSFIVA